MPTKDGTRMLKAEIGYTAGFARLCARGSVVAPARNKRCVSAALVGLTIGGRMRGIHSSGGGGRLLTRYAAPPASTIINTGVIGRDGLPVSVAQAIQRRVGKGR